MWHALWGPAVVPALPFLHLKDSRQSCTPARKDEVEELSVTALLGKGVLFPLLSLPLAVTSS